MGKQYEKKITWAIKNFSSLQSEKICSDQFVVGGSKWRLELYPKGNCAGNYLSLFLAVADKEALPSGRRRYTKFRLTVVNQLPGKLSQVQEAQEVYDQKFPAWGFLEMLCLTNLHAKDGGFLVNGELKIAAEVENLDVIGKSDVLEETSSVVEINGFQVIPSQVESVNSLFEKHPNIASKLRPKNPHLRTTYLNVLLSLTEILSKSPEALSNGDLADAYSSLRYVAMAGFKLDWLEKKLKEAGESRMQEIEEE
ncbi:MATH domain and coiled-coil domain-containing protein At1g31390-like [Eutrema salsugineum]|uniref:MATH domain and coiled-coil domain-containing protein At1g31390-like n=1 Tax=Eutrema salsugineum TaxID=72664 RepID=UPI000CED72A4|nr:MATH domain and coiled-coil domain-containing protein At1g31390-like [Eutrema salsugineum]